jgi:hypothetical protein
LAIAALLSAVAVLAGAPSASAAVEPVGDSAAELYDPSEVFVFRLALPKASWDGLEADSDKYQPGTFSFARSDGTPTKVGAFSTPMSVEIRLKGNFSFRPLSEKAGFKVRFPPAEPFFGLRVLTLNSLVSDPSMIHETLSYEAFRGVGVPASRSGYAYVYVNGEDFGVHLNLETMDRLALEKRFGPFDEEVQHLYEGEDGDDVWEDFEWSFEVDEGDEGDRSDLEALTEAVNSEGPPDWPTRVASVIDLEEMTRAWAVEKYVGHWDGYSGEEHSWTPNNYYLYSDSTGKFQMLPWGTDETWQAAHRLSFDGPAGRMFDRCLGDDACLSIYRDSVLAVHKTLAGMALGPLARDTAAMLAPWQRLEAEESYREEWSLEEIREGVEETCAFLVSRPGDAAAWLGSAAAGVGQPASCAAPPPQAPAGAGKGALTTPAPISPAGPSVRSLRVVRLAVKGGVLRTRLRLLSAGVVTLRASIPIRGKAILVCRKRVRVGAAGSLSLRCQLPLAVREQLREKPRRIKVVTRFVAAGDAPEVVSRSLPSGNG